MPHAYTRAVGGSISRADPGEPIPADVEERIKLIVLNSFGCGLLGSAMPWTQRLVATLRDTEKPRPCACLGHGRALLRGLRCYGQRYLRSWF